MQTLDDLIGYVAGLEGVTIRGRVVLDSDISLQADYSGKIILTVGMGRDFAERIMDDGESTELVWHFDDVREIDPESPRWEYWDEFADRTDREISNEH